MKKRVVVCTLAWGLSILSLAGCSGRKTDSAGETKLKVQFVPTNNDGTMEAKAKPFASYLSEKLGRQVDVTLATDYSTILEAMVSGKVDIGIIPPAAYVQARDQNAAQAVHFGDLPPSIAGAGADSAFAQGRKAAANH